ncbi:hypothetical protein HB852_07155 [Listeria grandensis]|uniref:Uncharacterized protein n=2 Tax=Listeria grandensis TaxID=1494963 RepID=W7BSH6_9LIST|nr:hypothetical protein [Listeria grandensis]EUJ23228.1 hypothetical protein PGRAN_09876 [Listeria grandensis FSL F6-0971]MBC1474392.1 hypothetical protein [Listeria grandensis]MBC1935934.1 hypothetical protein [Listeria grandensis]MBC6316458.1 hypothetical protein [Listeria grandensis]
MKKTILTIGISLFVLLSFMDIMLLNDVNTSTIVGALILGVAQTLIVLIPIVIIILLVKMIKKRGTN